MPDLATIEQCKNDKSIERTNLALKEGCQMYGYMEVNRVSIVKLWLRWWPPWPMWNNTSFSGCLPKKRAKIRYFMMVSLEYLDIDLTFWRQSFIENKNVCTLNSTTLTKDPIFWYNLSLTIHVGLKKLSKILPNLCTYILEICRLEEVSI